MTLSTSKQVRQRSLGLICVFSPGSIRREAASSPSRGVLQTLIRWILEFGSGGSSPSAPWGSVGVGRISCVTPSSAKLTTLASMAQVSCSVSSLMGMFEWNLGPSSVDGVGIALMWHSTAP